MQLQPARVSHECGFKNSICKCCSAALYLTFPIWMDHDTIEGDKQVDKVHREVQCPPYFIPISIYPLDFVAEAERRFE